MGLIKTLFNPKLANTSSMTPTITGRDLMSETSNEEPNSPVMGSEKKKNGGVSSLLVQSEDIYKGGI